MCFGCHTGAASLTATGSIMVQVVDVNDHEPTFPGVAREVSVSEAVGADSLVAVLLPRDGDHGDNGKLTCRIADGNQVSINRQYIHRTLNSYLLACVLQVLEKTTTSTRCRSLRM